MPIYSKNNDQPGPLSGNISPLPRTSYGTPGTAGIIHIVSIRATITQLVGAMLPSHLSHPVAKNAMAPITAPIISIG